jgi:hypothetical protein
MNYLKKGVKDTIKAVKFRKLLFFSLTFLQIIFLVLFFYTTLTYQLKIFDNIQTISQPLEEANYDVDSLKSGDPFTSEMGLIYKGYTGLVNNFIKMFSWLTFLFVFLNGAIWLLSHRMLKKYTGKELLQMGIKYVSSFLIAFVPLSIIAYYILKKMIFGGASQEGFLLVSQILLAIFLIMTYFFYVAITLINIKSWKKFAYNIYYVGIRKIHWSLIVLLINLTIIFGLLWLINLATISSNLFFLSLILVLILIIVLITTKIFWITSLDNLRKIKK